MVEGGIIEKFPDSWDPQYLWSVVVEYLLDNYPMDILIKRLVLTISLKLLFKIFGSGQIIMPFSHTELILWVLFRIILKMGYMLIQDESTCHLMPFPPVSSLGYFCLTSRDGRTLRLS